MFDILSRWRKASKCKRLIRKVQCRLKLLKNKRCTIVRQLRDDISQLLKQGHAQIALDRESGSSKTTTQQTHKHINRLAAERSHYLL